MWIFGQWYSAQTVDRIKAVVNTEPEISRRSLAKRVCEWLGRTGTDKSPREESARKALAQLKQKGIIELPKPKKSPCLVSKSVRSVNQSEDTTTIRSVCCQLEDLEGLEIIPVSSRYSVDSRTWNQMMREHHYLGAGTFCGTQIRYLIRDQTHGVIGGFSFSAACKRLKSRDDWIGWEERGRRANLHLVVNNSRFLIPSCVKVPNLASHALGLALKRLPKDFQERYGYEPVLVETFVDPKRFEGTCYKAANFQLIGETAGFRKEGFQNGKKSTGKKQVWIFPLIKDCQKRLCEKPREPLVIKGKAADAQDWADEEFGGAQLFEGRLRRRLTCIARDFFKHPGKSIQTACNGSKAKTRAAYRFFSNRRFNMNDLLKGHTEATLERCQKRRIILAVQDTTTVDYTSHPSTEGLGPITTKKVTNTGMVLHSTIGFSEEGTPIGILDAQCWARKPEEAGKKKTRHKRPIEDKESYKWLHSYRAVCEAQKLCPNTTFISTGDREADIYELFLDAQQTKNGPKLLIRANQSTQRKAIGICKQEDYTHLWDKLASEPLKGTLKIRTPRQGNRPARDATLEVRATQISLRPPSTKMHLAAVNIFAVYAREIVTHPSDNEPIDWMLLTTERVDGFESAVERIHWYSRRWGIEVFHRVLKTGARIEEHQLRKADSIKNCLAIDMVIAWRIHWLTMQGRETPELPCNIILSEEEWKILHAAVHNEPPPQKPPALRDAIRMIATLGGFLGRKCDGEPGTVTIWRGLDSLAFMLVGYRASLHLNARDGP